MVGSYGRKAQQCEQHDPIRKQPAHLTVAQIFFGTFDQRSKCCQRRWRCGSQSHGDKASEDAQKSGGQNGGGKGERVAIAHCVGKAAAEQEGAAGAE